MLVEPLVAGLVVKADEVDIRRIVQLMRAHLAHGKEHHARAALDVGLGHAGQLAARDLRRDQRLQPGLKCRIGQPGEAARHLLQGPGPAQIGQRRDQRHAPLGLPQPWAQRGEIMALEIRKLGGDRAFGVGAGGLQPAMLAADQAGEIGAAPGGAADQLGGGGLGPAAKLAGLCGLVGIEGARGAAQARGEIGHDRTVARRAGGVNRPAMPTERERERKMLKTFTSPLAARPAASHLL